MEGPDRNNPKINKNEEGHGARKDDVNDKTMLADDGFKTGKKTHGYTWETPMDEQISESESPDPGRRASDEEGD